MAFREVTSVSAFHLFLVSSTPHPPPASCPSPRPICPGILSTCHLAPGLGATEAASPLGCSSDSEGRLWKTEVSLTGWLDMVSPGQSQGALQVPAYLSNSKPLCMSRFSEVVQGLGRTLPQPPSCVALSGSDLHEGWAEKKTRPRRNRGGRSDWWLGYTWFSS